MFEKLYFEKIALFSCRGRPALLLDMQIIILLQRIFTIVLKKIGTFGLKNFKNYRFEITIVVRRKY